MRPASFYFELYDLNFDYIFIKRLDFITYCVIIIKHYNCLQFNFSFLEGKMSKENIDALKLENQLCFPLYACSKEIIRAYKPFLDEVDLTYTQYITIMVLWEKKEMNVKSLGEALYLDSGTLTPVLKKLETKGYIKRTRSKTDERNLLVSITSEGEALKERAVCIPEKIGSCVNLSPEDARELYRLLYLIISNVR